MILASSIGFSRHSGVESDSMTNQRVRKKIPATMVSQHPDHASTPYFLDKPFISTADETLEAYLNFSELGVSEYKWDWEGKLVDESVSYGPDF
jgi:hypothetical protein